MAVACADAHNETGGVVSSYLKSSFVATSFEYIDYFCNVGPHVGVAHFAWVSVAVFDPSWKIFHEEVNGYTFVIWIVTPFAFSEVETNGLAKRCFFLGSAACLFLEACIMAVGIWRVFVTLFWIID